MTRFVSYPKTILLWSLWWTRAPLPPRKRAAAKNQSKKALLFELNRRGIDRETAMDAAEALPGASDALDELIHTRLKGAIPDRALTEKTYRYLAGKGFAPGEIRAALRRYTRGEDFDE